MKPRSKSGEGLYPRGVVRVRARYRYWISVDGRKVYSGTFATAEEASRAREIRLAVADPLTLEGGIARVHDALTAASRSPGTVSAYEDRWRVLRSHFGSAARLGDISETAVQDFLRERMASVSAATVNKEIQALGRIFRVCRLPDPTAHVDRPRARPAPVRVMRAADWQEWRAAQITWAVTTPGDHRLDLLVPLLLWGTGMRRSEVARVRARDVDLERATVHVQGKNADRQIPLAPPVIEALAGWIERLGPGSPERPLLGLDAQRVSCLFIRWNRRLGTSWTPHALRHGVGTTLTEQGASLRTVMALLGHTTVGMALRYQHASDRSLREAVDRMPF